MACAELCFEALSVIQPCLVYQSYMSHTTVIRSRAVSTRRCYSCSTALASRWKKEARLIDWLERVMVLSAIRCDLETCLVLTRAICCFVNWFWKCAEQFAHALHSVRFWHFDFSPEGGGLFLWFYHIPIKFLEANWACGTDRRPC